METEHLREYITLSQSLNYAKAAEALFVSQPALRSHVKALEDEVGSPLIVKRDGRLELSMAGRLFLKLARDIVSLSDDALASCRALAENCTTLLVSTMGYAPFEKLLTSAREHLHARHPETEIGLRFLRGAHANLSTIVEKKADFSLLPRVRGIDDPEPPFDPHFLPDVSFLHLGTERCLFWMTNDNPLYHREIVHARDLEGQSLLLGNTDNMLAAGAEFLRYFAQAGARIELDPQPFACYDDYVYTPHDGFGIVVEQFHPTLASRSDFRMFSVAEFEIASDMLVIYDESRFDRCGQLFLDALRSLAPSSAAKG